MELTEQFKAFVNALADRCNMFTTCLELPNILNDRTIHFQTSELIVIPWKICETVEKD